MSKYLHVAVYKEKMRTLLWWSGSHMFLSFLFLAVCAIVLALTVLYQYVLFEDAIEAEITKDLFNEEVFKEVVRIESVRTQIFKEMSYGVKRDIFMADVQKHEEELTEE